MIQLGKYNISKQLYTIMSFVVQIKNRTNIQTDTFLIATLYFGKLCSEMEDEDMAEFGCVRKLWLSCLILATKYHDEFNHSFPTWSKWTGLDPGELNKFERFVLVKLGYNLTFNESNFEKTKKQIYVKSYSNHLKIVDMLNQHSQLRLKINTKSTLLPKINTERVIHVLTPPASPSQLFPTTNEQQ